MVFSPKSSQRIKRKREINVILECGYRLDLIVEVQIIVEVKSVKDLRNNVTRCDNDKPKRGLTNSETETVEFVIKFCPLFGFSFFIDRVTFVFYPCGLPQVRPADIRSQAKHPFDTQLLRTFERVFKMLITQLTRHTFATNFAKDRIHQDPDSNQGHG